MSRKSINAMIKVMQSYADSYQIEVVNLSNGNWQDVGSSAVLFNWVECDYRIKQE